MTSLLSEETVRRTEETSTSSERRSPISTSFDRVSILHLESMEQEHQMRISSLQQYVCELLLRNQQLRMALIELTATGSEDAGGGHAQRNPGPSQLQDESTNAVIIHALVGDCFIARAELIADEATAQV